MKLENKKLLSILLGLEMTISFTGCEGLKDYHTSQNSTTYSTSEIETTKNIYLTEQSTKEKEKPFIKDEGYVCALVNLNLRKEPDLSSEVLEVIPKTQKIVVKGINIRKKHIKPRKQGEEGGIIPTECAIHSSKVNVVCPKCGKATKIGYKIEKDEKVRICKKCEAIIK